MQKKSGQKNWYGANRTDRTACGAPAFVLVTSLWNSKPSCIVCRHSHASGSLVTCLSDAEYASKEVVGLFKGYRCDDQLINYVSECEQMLIWLWYSRYVLALELWFFWIVILAQHSGFVICSANYTYRLCRILCKEERRGRATFKGRWLWERPKSIRTRADRTASSFTNKASRIFVTAFFIYLLPHITYPRALQYRVLVFSRSRKSE